MRLRITEGWPVLEGSVGETIAPIIELLLCMADALRWSLSNSKRDCGAHGSLQWTKDIMRCYMAAQVKHGQHRDPLHAIPLTGDTTVRPTFCLVLRLLEACLTCDLLPADTPAYDFARLLDLLQGPQLPDLPSDTVEAVAARVAGRAEQAAWDAQRYQQSPAWQKQLAWQAAGEPQPFASSPMPDTSQVMADYSHELSVLTSKLTRPSTPGDDDYLRVTSDTSNWPNWPKATAKTDAQNDSDLPCPASIAILYPSLSGPSRLDSICEEIEATERDLEIGQPHWGATNRRS